MKILGIDPGYDLLGFGLIEVLPGNRFVYLDGGVIETDKKLGYWERIQQLAKDLDELISSIDFDVCAMEELFFTKNVKTAIKVAQARGVIGLALAKKGVPIFEYTPSQIKSGVVGNGRADKAAMQEMVKILLGFEVIPKPDDFADALAVALCHGGRGYG
jgi:crossover junction endodeoxyribonuclease RuvC